MSSFNKIIIVGHLGRDPELRYTPQGTAVCNFSVATSERRKDKTGEYQDVTTWFNVSLWGNRAEQVSPYLSKGKLVFIEGRLTTREYQDKEGNTRTSLDVNATDLQFVGPRSDDSTSVREERPARTESRVTHDDNADSISDDDIPF